MEERERILKEIGQEYTEPLRDTVWKNILFSAPLLRLLEVPSFQKLNGIKQLGPTFLVYPGATHTRLNHSLGVFHLARRMITHLLRKREVPGCTRFGVRAFLVAALLHDLGHYPYAHSLKDLALESHEALTAWQICGGEIARVITDEVETDPELVAAIIDSKRGYEGSENLAFFRNLLSGVLDPDKLDYLNRDAYFCGVPYGIQDVDFVLSEIFPSETRGMAVSEKGLTAVESILFSKYLMYRTVYWHKTVRVVTAMIKKAVLLGLTSGRIEAADLYGLDDRGFISFTTAADYPPFRLIERVAGRRLYKCLYRVPFDEENPLHRSLGDLGRRLAFEQELALEAGRACGRKVRPEQIIIDIPEPISFEIDLPVIDNSGQESRSFGDSGSVFDRRVVAGFTRTLRQISLISDRDEEIYSALRKLGGEKIIREGI